jgi:hypothetical protein
MISNVLLALQKNFAQVPGMASVPFYIGPEYKEQQDSARRIEAYPIRARGAGPNIYSTSPSIPGTTMVRKRWLVCEFRVWGLPSPVGSIPNNTDDAELLLSNLVASINNTTPGSYHFVDEVWNNKGEVMMYGRSVTLHVEFEVALVEVSTGLTSVQPTFIQLTPVMNTAGG